MFKWADDWSRKRKGGLAMSILSGAWWAADHYGRLLTAIGVMEGVPRVIHSVQPYATPILAVSGLGLIVWDIVSRRKLTAEKIPTATGQGIVPQEHVRWLSSFAVSCAIGIGMVPAVTGVAVNCSVYFVSLYFGQVISPPLAR